MKRMEREAAASHEEIKKEQQCSSQARGSCQNEKPPSVPVASSGVDVNRTSSSRRLSCEDERWHHSNKRGRSSVVGGKKGHASDEPNEEESKKRKQIFRSKAQREATMKTATTKSYHIFKLPMTCGKLIQLTHGSPMRWSTFMIQLIGDC